MIRSKIDEAKEEIRGGIMKRNINELKVFISIAIKGVERAKVLLSLIDSFENEDEMENFTKRNGTFQFCKS